MILWGKKRVDTSIAIECLDASKFQFNLTGSRFLECEQKESDYDFFTQDSPEVRAFLNLMEFQELAPPKNHTCTIGDGGCMEAHYHLDPSVSSVWRRAKVDIQLVEDPELRLKMQNIIKGSKLGYLFKDCRLAKKQVDSIVWRAAWQLIKAGKEDAK
jgi:hypothetical protein